MSPPRASVPVLVCLMLALSACGGEGSDAGSGGAGGEASGGGAGDSSGGAPGGGGAGGARDFDEIAAELEQAVQEHESEVPFTLILGNEEGTFFEASHGDSTADTLYESASTSKWVAAAVILNSVLDLDLDASDVLPFWTNDPSDWRSRVTLRQLLSFTSGMQPEGALTDAGCISLPGADFASCVETIYDEAGERSEAPGTEFVYGSHHLQVAGLMAMNIYGADTFAELFAEFQSDHELFPSGAFDLPSIDNPRLAGGMHWTGREFMEFLHALFVGDLLSPGFSMELFTDHTPAGAVEIVESPPWAGLGEMWHYDLGNWQECPSAAVDQAEWLAACGELGRHSSPGAYGAYPFIDFGQGFYGILARQGALGTFRDGLDVYRDLAPLAEELARAANER